MPLKSTKDYILDLQNPEPSLRRAAAEELGKKKEAIAVKPLCDALRDPAAHVRWTAAAALGDIGDRSPFVIDVLIKALDDPDAPVREYAARALDALGDQRAVIPILRALTKYQQTDLAGAIHHLSLDKDAVPLLAKNLEFAIADWKRIENEIRDDWGLAHVYDPRRNAVGVFRRIQDPAATPALVEMLRTHPNEQYFIKAAYLTFENLGGNALPYLIAEIKRPDDRGRTELLSALGVLGDINALKALVAEVGAPHAALLLSKTLDPSMIRDDEPGTRSLKKMGWAAAEEFIALLKHMDKEIREAAARAVTHVRDRRATPYLLEALRSEQNSGIQGAIIWGFQALADPATLFVLIAELEGNSYHAAQMALEAIAQEAREETKEALLVAKLKVRPEARERIDWVLDQIK